MEYKKLKYVLARHSSYILLIISAYVLESTPRLLDIGGVRPNLLIPVIVVIAMYEGEYAGGLYGIFAGILLDTMSFLLFGFNSMLLLVIGCAAGLLTLYLIQNTIKSAIVCAFCAISLQALINFFFLYGMWGYAGAHNVLLGRVLPSVVYSTLCTIPIYFGIGRLYKKLMKHLEE